MIKRLLFVSAILAAGLSPAFAQTKGQYWAAERAAHPGSLSLEGPTYRLSARMVAEAGRFLGWHRSPTGFKGAWCGDFLGYVAAKVGAPRPRDYRLARSWAREGRRLARPAPGAVAVARHHVGIVLRVLPHGEVLVRSGNHGHRVADSIYSQRYFFAYRAI